MSRIGKKPITIPAGVQVTVDANNLVTVTGPKGKLTQEVKKEVAVKINGNEITVENIGKSKNANAFHGLYRQLIANMIEGVNKGFTKRLTINGVGYKITQKGSDLVLNIGYSHPVEVKAVEGITLSFEKNEVIVSGISKEAVGQFAATIRNLRPVEPYHAYGIYYSDEQVRRKEIKSGKK
jgi:large subunit ribosomal protein L6